MNINKKRITRFLLFAIVLTPLLLISALLSATVQKYLLEHQLRPWIDDIQVEYIHITPFSFKVDNLHLKYQDIDVRIGQLDTQFSPFELFSGRIRIDKLLLNNTIINDQSSPEETKKNSSKFLFPGLFPYLNIGYIYDITELNIVADYISAPTGKISLRVNAENVNEIQSQPINIDLNANEIKDLPDIKKINLHASVFLNQRLPGTINRQNTTANINLETDDGVQQNINLKLAMEQLPKPPIWSSYPFDKLNIHYLTRILHPEKIQLEIRHTESDTLLSHLNYNGIYDGNEGIISGKLELLTEKGFLTLFKSLQLPEIKSNLSAQFSYNTHTLDGYVDLKDNFKIRQYIANNHSLPEELDIDNHLKMKLVGDMMKIDSFLLNILSENKEYVKLQTHKQLHINLNNLQALLDQQQSNLFSIQINQLPLKWFNDYLSPYKILTGILDTNIDLSVANRSLLLKSERPLSIKNLNLVEHKTTPEAIANNTDKTIITNPDEQAVKQENQGPEVSPEVIRAAEPETLLVNQFIESDFNITVSDKNLSAVLKRLDLFQLKPQKIRPQKTGSKDTADNAKQTPGQALKHQQLVTSLQLNLNAPLASDLLTKPLTFFAKGQLHINELIKIPLLSQTLKKQFTRPVSSGLPEQLKLDYQLAVKGNNSLWTLDKFNLAFNAPKHPDIITIANLQSIQLKQNTEQIQLLSKDKLLSLKINQFDFKWLAPIINQYAEPYSVSGQLASLNTTLSSPDMDKFDLSIHHLNFSALKLKNDKQVLFEQLKLKFKSLINYTPGKISIHYPTLAIEQGSNNLLTNKGSVVISQLDQTRPQIALQGNLKARVNNLMKLKLLNQYTHQIIREPSVLDGNYQLTLLDQQLNISRLLISVFHPRSKGRMDIATHNPINSPIKISLKEGKQNFSQNGHLSLKLTNFDLAPYEVLFPQLPVTFDKANAQLSLIQKNNKQTLKFEKPLTLTNVHYKNKKKALLKPFNMFLNGKINQYGKTTHASIKQLAVKFISQKNNALDLNADFKLNSARSVPVTDLNAHLNILLTQWLSQPGIMPDNTLASGVISADFTMDKLNKLQHKWQIKDLTDNKDQQIIKSVYINGTGEIRKLNDLILNFPIVMQSLSGTTELTINNHFQIIKNKPSIDLTLNAKDIFLNDLLKLLAAINPESELSKLEKEKEQEQVAKETKIPAKTQAIAPDNTPAQTPFWPTAMDIQANLDIGKLYYSDYMSYHHIKGKLTMNKHQLTATDFMIRFHDSPMSLNAAFKFTPGKKQPYDINLRTSLTDFYVGGFLKELNPNHVPRADGVFDVAVKFYGPLSNLAQIRNELMFNIDISGVNGVYHLIPANDVMVRSSGYAMAVVGEVVSVLPTSGFGLGIINRVVRFAKDINYDLIHLSMSRQVDLNTRINIFEILSPELHLSADGQITFAPNTRLIDQELNMKAHLNLSGEGAAIFYGLGLLNDTQDKYGFWEGPTIKFWGSISNQQDNFDEIINNAEQGTLAGGITNPFSGLVGNFKYRWTGTKPDYSELLKKYNKPEQTVDKDKDIENKKTK